MKKTNPNRVIKLAAILITILSLTACELFHILTEEEFFINKYDINTDIITPGMRSYTYSQSPLLKWPSINNAVSYDFQFSSDEDFSGTLLADIKNTVSCEYQISTLPDYNRYYWRIKVYFNDGNISPWLEYAFSYLSSDTFEHFEDFKEDGFSTLHNWQITGDFLPVIQDSNSYDGFYAVGMGNSKDSGESRMSVAVDLEKQQILSFQYQKNDSDSYFRFYLDGYRETHEADTTNGWTQFRTLLPSGNHILMWEYENYSTADKNVLFIDSIKLADIPTFVNDDFEIVDGSFSTLNNWYLSGEALPYIQSAKSYCGSNAVQFGNTSSGSECIFQTTIFVAEDCTISFHALKENSNWTFGFNIDDYSKLSTISRINEWTEYKYNLSTGAHTLKWWVYSSSAADNVYIDNIIVGN